MAELAAGVPPRWDVPVRQPYTRGSRNKVAQILFSIGGIASAIKEARRGRYAATTVGPKRERRRLIRWILRRAGGSPVFPLSEESLECLTGVLRKAGYRSAEAYLSEAKDVHIARGYPWTEQLARCFRLCRAAANRGLGPPKRAAEIRIACVADASRERIAAAVSVRGGFLQPHAAWLVACWWLLREVELAGLALHISHVSCDEARTTLHLPTSKADTGGLGKSRTLRWICHITALGDGGVPGGAVCASCTAQAQVALMERACGFSCRDERAKLVPLFPCALGRACSKEGAVASWRALAGSDWEGLDLVSGHSARRSGAKLLARCGWAA